MRNAYEMEIHFMDAKCSNRALVRTIRRQRRSAKSIFTALHAMIKWMMRTSETHTKTHMINVHVRRALPDMVCAMRAVCVVSDAKTE